MEPIKVGEKRVSLSNPNYIYEVLCCHEGSVWTTYKLPNQARDYCTIVVDVFIRLPIYKEPKKLYCSVWKHRITGQMASASSLDNSMPDYMKWGYDKIKEWELKYTE